MNQLNEESLRIAHVIRTIIDAITDHLQILLLIFSKFKRINGLLFPLICPGYLMISWGMDGN